MPRPPVERSDIPAEADFEWAMERLRHAIEMFLPPSSLGIRVKREMDYELNPPDKDNSNYTADVTITTRTIYSAGRLTSPREQQKKEQERKEKQAAIEKAKRDVFALPGEEPITGTTTSDDDLNKIEQDTAEVPNPVVPQPELDYKDEIKLEYVNDKWKQLNRAKEEHVQLWFDYALQQGEYDHD
ncbi:hypothetical protein [Bythopirellula polymerisocia]|nr:hypothetical protein [Bythopirellula polymerisocia]